MLSGITDCPKKKKKEILPYIWYTVNNAAGSFRWRIRLLVAGDKLDIVTSNIKFGIRVVGERGCRLSGLRVQGRSR